jgi:DNA-directed RNA polymerase specialized sigma24 family protein
MDTHTVSPNNRERYEIFRHAIANRDDAALADVVAWYRPLLIAWAHQKLDRIPIEESCADIADEAFARAWSALAATGLDTFPSLATVLGYLRTCVASVVVDRARSQSGNARLLARMEITPQVSPEQAVLAELDRAEIWSLINRHIVTEQERIVVYESFALNLPPRAIVQRYPSIFDDVREVYRIKHNLFDRLRRDEELRKLYGE